MFIPLPTRDIAENRSWWSFRIVLCHWVCSVLEFRLRRTRVLRIKIKLRVRIGSQFKGCQNEEGPCLTVDHVHVYHNTPCSAAKWIILHFNLHCKWQKYLYIVPSQGTLWDMCKRGCRDFFPSFTPFVAVGWGSYIPEGRDQNTFWLWGPLILN